MIKMKIRGKIDIYIISAYAPTAEAQEEDKDKFYDELKKHINKHKIGGVTYVGADMNAEIKEPGDSPSDGIGEHIFGYGQQIGEGAGVEDNRRLLQDFLISTQTVLSNTYFHKQPVQHDNVQT